MVDIVVADKTHIGVPAEVIKADSEAGPIPVARREDIIRLKQSRNSKQDQADIEALDNDDN